MKDKNKGWFRSNWTPQEADEWTKEDYWALVFSSLSYIFLTIGVGLCFLLTFMGLIYLTLGLLAGWMMYRVIDPKLRTLSDKYETKQKQYLKELDLNMKWEDKKDG